MTINSIAATQRPLLTLEKGAGKTLNVDDYITRIISFILVNQTKWEERQLLLVNRRWYDLGKSVDNLGIIVNLVMNRPVPSFSGNPLNLYDVDCNWIEEFVVEQAGEASFDNLLRSSTARQLIGDYPKNPGFIKTLLKLRKKLDFSPSYFSHSESPELKQIYLDEKQIYQHTSDCRNKNPNSDELKQLLSLVAKFTRENPKIFSHLVITKSEPFVTLRQFGLETFTTEDQDFAFLMCYCNFLDVFDDISDLIKQHNNIWNSREICLELLRFNRSSYSQIPEDFKKDRSFALEAVKLNCTVFEFLEIKFRDDEEIAYAAIRRKPFLLEFASDNLKNNKQLVIYALKKESHQALLSFASSQLQDDEQVVILAVSRDPSNFMYSSERLKKERSFVLRIVSKNGSCLAIAPTFWDDEEIVLAALKNGGSLEYASERLQGEHSIVLEAVKINGENFRYVSDSLKNNLEIVREAVLSDPRLLDGLRHHTVLIKLINCKDSMLKVIKKTAQRYIMDRRTDWLRDMAKMLRDDLVATIETLTDEQEIIRFGSCICHRHLFEYLFPFEDLIDKKFIITAIITNPHLFFCFASDLFQKDKTFLLDLMMITPDNLYSYSYDDVDDGLKQLFRNNKEFFLDAIERDHHALCLADKGFDNKIDDSFLFEAIKRNYRSIEYLSDQQKDNQLIDSLKIHADQPIIKFLLSYHGDDIKNDKNSLLEAAKIDELALGYASSDLKKNKDFILESFKLNFLPQQLFHFFHYSTLLPINKNIFIQNEIFSRSGPLNLSGIDSFELTFELMTRIDWRFFHLAPPFFKNSEHHLLGLIPFNANFFAHASEELKDNKEFILKLIKENPWLLARLNDTLRHDKDILKAALNAFGGKQVFQDFEKNESLIFEALTSKRTVQVLQYANDSLCHNPKLILMAVTANGWALQYASAELRNDPAIVLAAIKSVPWAYVYASQELKQRRDFQEKAVETNGLTLPYMCEELKNNKEIVAKAKESSKWRPTGDLPFYWIPGEAKPPFKPRKKRVRLDLASEESRKSKIYVLCAVSKDGLSLEYVSQDLKEDPEVVLKALFQDEKAFIYASKQLQEDGYFLLKAIKLNPLVLAFVSEKMLQNWDFMCEAMKLTPLALKYSPDEWRNDPERVLQAVLAHEEAIDYASESLKNNRDFAIRIRKRGKKYLPTPYPEKLKYDFDYINQFGPDLSLESYPEYQMDKAFVLLSVKTDSTNLEFASDELKNNQEILQAAWEAL